MKFYEILIIVVCKIFSVCSLASSGHRLASSGEASRAGSRCRGRCCFALIRIRIIRGHKVRLVGVVLLLPFLLFVELSAILISPEYLQVLFLN